MNKEDNETLKYFKKVYDELMQDKKYQKYTSLINFYHKKIEDLQHQVEEKDKAIDEAIEYINQQIFDMTVVGNGTLSLDRLLEILERDKNENTKN